MALYSLRQSCGPRRAAMKGTRRGDGICEAGPGRDCMADSDPIKRRDQAGERGVGSELEELEALEPGAQQFVEGMGLYFERLGIPRIGGRILRLFILAQGPPTLDDMGPGPKVRPRPVRTNRPPRGAGGLGQD